MGGARELQAIYHDAAGEKKKRGDPLIRNPRVRRRVGGYGFHTREWTKREKWEFENIMKQTKKRWRSGGEKENVGRNLVKTYSSSTRLINEEKKQKKGKEEGGVRSIIGKIFG